LHTEFSNIWHFFYPYAWSLFFSIVLEETVNDRLKKIVKNQNKREDIMKIISQPYLITPIMESEIAILELAKDLMNDKDIKHKAKKLSGKFGWISVYNFDDNPRKADYYINEAKEIINQKIGIDKRLIQLKNSRLENERKYKNFLKKINKRLLRKQIELLHLTGYLRDIREETRDKLTLVQRELYEIIAKKIGLKLNEIIYLTNTEIESALKSKIKKNKLKEIAQSRKKTFVLLVKNNKFQVLDNINSIKKIMSMIKMEKPSILQGKVACKKLKTISGTVKIVLSNMEVNKVKKGDVLVSSMTKPDYINAIKKSIAIITDEGGITSHASIISREMNKPCIIGTKIATKVFKDGDYVEVDANKGIVKKIEKVKKG